MHAKQKYVRATHHFILLNNKGCKLAKNWKELPLLMGVCVKCWLQSCHTCVNTGIPWIIRVLGQRGIILLKPIVLFDY